MAPPASIPQNPVPPGIWLEERRGFLLARTARTGVIRTRGVMRRLIRVVVLIGLGLVLLPYVLTPIYSAGHPISTLMIGRYFSGEPVTRKWIDIDAIAPALPRSVVAAEDAKFCFHHGIDWDSVQDVLEDAQEGEVSRGGSTITQQVAKNLFLWPGRSVIRKALEFPLALWIDFIFAEKTHS